MKKKIGYIVLFLIINLIIIAAEPSGMLEIKVSLSGVNGTKIYDYGNEMMIDAGVVNKDFDIVNERVIGRVDVTMKAIPRGNIKNEDPCLIGGGEFNTELKLDNLRSIVENSEIPLNLIVYNGKEGSTSMTLNTKNYKENSKIIINKDEYSEDYIFSAYPEQCNFKNKIKEFSYSFDLVLKLKNIENGNILGGEVKIETTSGKSALKDLVTSHMLGIGGKVN